jgi:hypothetical protein
MMYWVNTLNLLINLSGTLFAFFVGVVEIKKGRAFPPCPSILSD